HELAGSHNNLGYLLQGRGRLKEAEEAYRQALDIRQKLARDFPAVPGYRQDLGGTYGNLGNLERDNSHPQAALAWYAKALATLQPLLDRDSRQRTTQLSLRNVHWGRARVLGVLGRHAEAVKDLDRALALDRGRSGPFFRIRRALALAQAGDHATAVAEANSLSNGKDGKGATLYDAACVCALASASVKGDDELRDRYASPAVDLLP